MRKATNLSVSLAFGAVLVLASFQAGLAAEKTAIFAGGCFWCMESDFEGVPGVTKVISGYAGGPMKDPTYRNHGQNLEAVKVYYDDGKVTYAQLVHTYWRSIDPTDAGGQFCDRGHSYTTAIFVANPQERQLAEETKAETARILGEPVATKIRDVTTFTEAEDYHQDYYKKNPASYSYYRRGCGRDAVIKQLWGNEAHAGITMTH